MSDTKKETKSSHTDPQSGYMVRDGKLAIVTVTPDDVYNAILETDRLEPAFK